MLFLLQRKKRKIDIYFVGVNILLSIFIRNNFQSNDVADMCGRGLAYLVKTAVDFHKVL